MGELKSGVLENVVCWKKAGKVVIGGVKSVMERCVGFSVEVVVR